MSTMFVLMFVAVIAVTDAVTPLKCRYCNNAVDLSDCNREISCDVYEECYMDQIITDSLTTVYNGGCRSTDICRLSASSSVIGRRSGIISCSRCCGDSQGCNIHLCGIPDRNISSATCYACDHSQTSDCTLMTLCQHDELCYATETMIAGQPSYTSGCRNKMVCKLLMQQVFLDMDRCSGPSPDPLLCGATNMCQACCGYGGCNSGSCQDITQRLYTMYKNHVLDMDTFSPIP